MANVLARSTGAPEPAAVAGTARHAVIDSRRQALILLLPPALLIFTLFVILPIGEAAHYSFYRWNGYGSPEKWVGLKNYLYLFNHAPFRTAFVNNLLIILVSLAVQLPLALYLAVLLSNRIAGAAVFRLIFFLPYVLAEIAAGLIWRFVYDGDYGILAGLFGLFGAPAPFVLAEADLAIYAILSVIVWKFFGFHMMLYVAGIQAIDKHLYEAAVVDGATKWQLFRHVTLPQLSSTIKLSVFFSVIGALQLFDLIMPMTKGGPSDSTQTMVTYLYNYGITRMRIGFGSAIGVVLFVICVTFAFTYNRYVMRHEH